MRRAFARSIVIAGVGCGGTMSEGDDPLTTTSSDSTGRGASTSGSDPAASESQSESDSEGDSGSTSSTSDSDDDSSTSGTPTCNPRVVLMGYWPPTNEMLRPWSTNIAQNPDGWIGEDWGGYGYDVYSFFPEFPPDGDPTNDDIGEDGSVGSPESDLRVDYQATSEDFWRIVDEYQPVIVLTTSRGGDIGWELEALEGGHGVDNRRDPSLDWISDAHGRDVLPTMATIDVRSWDAIATHRQGATLPTALPVEAIVDATSVLGVTDVVVDDAGTSGNFLSGFLGLHGLHWQLETRYAVAAGHIHVGFGLPVADASTLIEATLTAILQEHPPDLVPCDGDARPVTNTRAARPRAPPGRTRGPRPRRSPAPRR